MPPQTKKRPVKAKGYTPLITEGRLFRVRDKDYGDGSEVKIWGENLTYKAAQSLREQVCGSLKSRTARIEDMGEPVPSADPSLEGARQKGLAAGRGAAHAAQQRADQLAARKRQEMQAASTPKPQRPQPVLVKKPPVPPAVKLDDTDLDAPDVIDETDLGEDDELAAAVAGAGDDITEYETKGKELYEAWSKIGGAGAVHKPWGEMPPKDQAAWSFEAASEQGPHIDQLHHVAPPKSLATDTSSDD